MKRLPVNIIISLIFLISGITAFSQEYILGLDDYVGYANIKRTNSPTASPYSQIKGSPFLFDDFITGQIKLKNGKIYQGPLRYDIYGNQIEFKTSNGDVLSVVNPGDIESVVLRDAILVYVSENSSKDKGSFYEEKVSGKYDLFVKHNVAYKDPEPAKPYFEPKPATFVKKDNEYFVNSDAGLIQIKNKNTVLDVLPEKKSEIESYIKKEKLKISEEVDLVKIVELLNKLAQ